MDLRDLFFWCLGSWELVWFRCAYEMKVKEKVRREELEREVIRTKVERV